MFNADDLASLRALQEENMPDLSTIERQTLADDASGGQSDAWQQVAAGVKCRIDASGRDPQAREMAARLGVAVVYVVIFPVGTDAQEGDRVTITGRAVALRAVAPINGSYQTAHKCLCVEWR